MKQHNEKAREGAEMDVRTLGIDLAKNLFRFTVWMRKAGRSCSASSDAGS
jgi:hypothetical protein